MMIYPAPANDVINISLMADDADGPAAIDILNMQGKNVYSTRSSGSRFIKINVSRLIPGTYNLQIMQNEKAMSRLITICR